LEDVTQLTRATQILNRFNKEDALAPAEDSNKSDGENCSEEYHPEGSSSQSCSSSEDEPKRKRSHSPPAETSPKEDEDFLPFKLTTKHSKIAPQDIHMPCAKLLISRQ